MYRILSQIDDTDDTTVIVIGQASGSLVANVWTFITSGRLDIVVLPNGTIVDAAEADLPDQLVELLYSI